MIVYANTETTVKAFLLDSAVAPLVKRPDGGYSIYNAMPPKAPNPAVVAFQIAGGPINRKDLPEQQVTIQFDCWGTSRLQASTLALTVIGELENLALYGGRVIDGVYLGTISTTNMRWLPEPDSDTPRYIVDALITTVT